MEKRFKIALFLTIFFLSFHFTFSQISINPSYAPEVYTGYTWFVRAYVYNGSDLVDHPSCLITIDGETTSMYPYSEYAYFEKVFRTHGTREVIISCYDETISFYVEVKGTETSLVLSPSIFYLRPKDEFVLDIKYQERVTAHISPQIIYGADCNLSIKKDGSTILKKRVMGSGKILLTAPEEEGDYIVSVTCFKPGYDEASAEAFLFVRKERTLLNIKILGKKYPGEEIVVIPEYISQETGEKIWTGECELNAEVNSLKVFSGKVNPNERVKMQLPLALGDLKVHSVCYSPKYEKATVEVIEPISKIPTEIEIFPSKTRFYYREREWIKFRYVRKDSGEEITGKTCEAKIDGRKVSSIYDRLKIRNLEIGKHRIEIECSAPFYEPKFKDLRIEIIERPTRIDIEIPSRIIYSFEKKEVEIRYLDTITGQEIEGECQVKWLDKSYTLTSGGTLELNFPAGGREYPMEVSCQKYGYKSSRKVFKIFVNKVELLIRERSKIAKEYKIGNRIDFEISVRDKLGRMANVSCFVILQYYDPLTKRAVKRERTKMMEREGFYYLSIPAESPARVEYIIECVGEGYFPKHITGSFSVVVLGEKARKVASALLTFSALLGLIAYIMLRRIM